MCLEIACLVIANGWASSLSVASERDKRATMARRAYLAQLVSMRTGLAADEAQQRVTMVESDARESIKAARHIAPESPRTISRSVTLRESLPNWRPQRELNSQIRGMTWKLPEIRVAT